MPPSTTWYTGNGQIGLIANRPAASSILNGYEFFATDVAGGTLYKCDGASWLTVAAGSAPAWTTYAPAWGSFATQPAIVDGTIVGRYQQVGKLTTVFVRITAGASTTFGSGGYTFSLPVAPHASIGSFDWMGRGVYQNNAGGYTFVDAVLFATVVVLSYAPNAIADATNPLALAAGYTIEFTLTYEAA